MSLYSKLLTCDEKKFNPVQMVTSCTLSSDKNFYPLDNPILENTSPPSISMIAFPGRLPLTKTTLKLSPFFMLSLFYLTQVMFEELGGLGEGVVFLFFFFTTGYLNGIALWVLLVLGQGSGFQGYGSPVVASENRFGQRFK